MCYTWIWFLKQNIQASVVSFLHDFVIALRKHITGDGDSATMKVNRIFDSQGTGPQVVPELFLYYKMTRWRRKKWLPGILPFSKSFSVFCTSFCYHAQFIVWYGINRKHVPQYYRKVSECFFGWMALQNLEYILSLVSNHINAMLFPLLILYISSKNPSICPSIQQILIECLFHVLTTKNISVDLTDNSLTEFTVQSESQPSFFLSCSK
jgi:hypothetical protein